MKYLIIIAGILIFLIFSTYENVCLGEIGTQNYMTGSEGFLGKYCKFAGQESIIWGKIGK